MSEIRPGSGPTPLERHTAAASTGESAGAARRRAIREAMRGTGGGAIPVSEPLTPPAHGGGHTEPGHVEHGSGSSRNIGERLRASGEYIKAIGGRRDLQVSILTGVGLAAIRAGIVWGTGQQMELPETIIFGAAAGAVRGITSEFSEKFRRIPNADKVGYKKAVIEGMFWGALGAGLGSAIQGGRSTIDTSDYGWQMKIAMGAGIGAATGVVNRAFEAVKNRNWKDLSLRNKGMLMNMVGGAILGGAVVGVKEMIDSYSSGSRASVPERPQPPAGSANPESGNGAPTQAPVNAEPTRGEAKPGGGVPPNSDVKPAVSPTVPATPERIQLPSTIPTPGERLPLPATIPTPGPRGELSDNLRTLGNVVPLNEENNVFSKVVDTGAGELQQASASPTAVERYVKGLGEKNVHFVPEIHQKVVEQLNDSNTFLASPEVNKIINESPSEAFKDLEANVYAPQEIGPEWSSLKGKIEGWIGEDFFHSPDAQVVAEIQQRVQAEGVKFWDEDILEDLKTGAIDFDPYNADHARILHMMQESATGKKLFDKEFLGSYMAVKLDNPETGGAGSIFHKDNSDYFKHGVELKSKNPGVLVHGLRLAA